MSKSKPEMRLPGSSLSVCAVVVLMLAGCVLAPPATPVAAPPVTVAPVNTPQEVEPPPPNPEILRALSQLADIRDELKQLRNSVEELQFQSDRDQRRRRDLYQDVDRRLLELERAMIAERVAAAAADGTGEEDESLLGVQPVEGGLQEPDDRPAGLTEPSLPNVDDSPAPDDAVTVSLDEQNAYDEAFGLLRQSRYQDFILAAEQFVTDWPNSQLVDDIWYWMSEAHYVNREFESALSGFRAVVIRYPGSERVPEALLKTGYIQYDIGAYDEAAEIFRDVLARFPEHHVAISAQTRLRRIEQTIQ